MKIGLCIEVSSKAKTHDVEAALERAKLEYINIGMTGDGEETELTYIETGFLSALFLHLGIVDMIVGGCGTGQGYLNCVMQYPGVSAGLIQEAADAFLFSQINGGNVVSLALNKGYGSFGADINLDYIFEKLFLLPPGGGFPPYRVESQQASRKRLKDVSSVTHYTMMEILQRMDPAFIRKCIGFNNNLEYIKAADSCPEKDFVLSVMEMN